MVTRAAPVVQGAPWSGSVVLQLDDGTPVDLGGATISAVFQDPQETTTVQGTVTMSIATGAFVLSLQGSDTAQFPPGLVFGQIQITTAAGIFFSDSFPLAVSTPLGGA